MFWCFIPEANNFVQFVNDATDIRGMFCHDETSSTDGLRFGIRSEKISDCTCKSGMRT